MALRCRTPWDCWPKDGGLYGYRPAGIAWGDETAHIIFLLAISKREYEEAMAIYDIFVTFLRERAMSRLATTRSFNEFKTVAMECVSRF